MTIHVIKIYVHRDIITRSKLTSKTGNCMNIKKKKRTNKIREEQARLKLENGTIQIKSNFGTFYV